MNRLVSLLRLVEGIGVYVRRGGGRLSDHIALVTLNCDQRQKISNFELILTSLSGWKKKKLLEYVPEYWNSRPGEF